MASPTDNLKWFLLETALPMLDIAIFIMHHIERLDISNVSNKVRVDLLRIMSAHTKSKCKYLALYIEPIAIFLMVLMYNENFRVEKFIEPHSSIMATASAARPLVSGEQMTLLTSNLSDRSMQDNAPQQQKLISPQNLKLESIQLESIQEQTVLEGGVLGTH